MSYRDTSMPPGEWHPNDFEIGDRIYVDLGGGKQYRCTVTGNNKADYTDLALTVEWVGIRLKGDVYPNLQWVGLLPKEDDDG